MGLRPDTYRLLHHCTCHHAPSAVRHNLILPLLPPLSFPILFSSSILLQQVALDEHQGSNQGSDDLSSKSLGLTDSDLDCYDQDDVANSLRSVPNWLEQPDTRKIESTKHLPEPESDKERFRSFLMGVLHSCTPAQESDDASMWNQVVNELKTTMHV